MKLENKRKTKQKIRKIKKTKTKLKTLEFSDTNLGIRAHVNRKLKPHCYFEFSPPEVPKMAFALFLAIFGAPAQENPRKSKAGVCFLHFRGPIYSFSLGLSSYPPLLAKVVALF